MANTYTLHLAREELDVLSAALEGREGCEILSNKIRLLTVYADLHEQSNRVREQADHIRKMAIDQKKNYMSFALKKDPPPLFPNMDLSIDDTDTEGRNQA